MEFRKMSPVPGPPAAPSASKEAGLRTHLRMMARRHLHGARGILFIAGSLLLVISMGSFATTSGLFGNLAGGTDAVFKRWSANGLNKVEWTGLIEVGIGAFVVSCGWLVVAMPRLATILPVFILITKAVLDIAIPLVADEKPKVNTAFVELVLAAVLIKAVRDANGFHRDAEALRLHLQQNNAPAAPGGWKARLPGYVPGDDHTDHRQ